MDPLWYFRWSLISTLFCLTLFVNNCQADTCAMPENLADATMPDSTIIINEICIYGNTITKIEIIRRELNFREHDTVLLSGLAELLKTSRQNIFNTKLFNFVTIDTFSTGHQHSVDIRIDLTERWYIWPIPFFEFSDRNFNVWWETKELQKLTYGIDFTFFNVRGRNETLKILTHFGYNQKFGFVYKMPYLNTRKTIGAVFGAALELSRELPVVTKNNEPVYIRSNAAYLKKMINGSGELLFRPDFYSIHTFRVGYSYYHFDSLVRKIPGFVIKDSDIQQFVTFNYLCKNDHRDVQYYPLKGYCLELELNHSVPYTTAYNSYFRANLRVYVPLKNRWYLATGLSGKLSFEKEQPYYLLRGLGYQRDYVRGYEYYVVNGQHYGLLKNNLKFALLPPRVVKLGFLSSPKFNTVPLAMYLNAFMDMGYVYNYSETSYSIIGDGNTLENSLLIGYGIGLDLATYYDLVVRVECSINRMGIPGFYLHFVSPI